MKQNFSHFRQSSNNYYSLVLRFRNLSKRIDKLVKTGRFYERDASTQTSLLAKLKRLFNKLSTFNYSYALKLAGATACMALVTNVASATTPPFTKWEAGSSPFEFTTINGSTDFKVVDGAFADIDGDGDLDAALLIIKNINKSADPVNDFIYFENVEGVFTENSEDNPFANVNEYSDVAAYRSIDIADFDNDNDLDLITVATSSGVQIIHYELYSGQFDYVSGSDINDYVYFDIKKTRYGSVKFMDIDADDDLDLIGTYETDNDDTKIFALYQNDEHVFSKRDDSPSFGDDLEISPDYLKLSIADMDADGDDDLFVFANSGDFCTYYENDGEGNYTVKTSASEIPLPIDDLDIESPTLFADLDGDLDIDIFQPGSYGGTDQAAFENKTNTPTGIETSETSQTQIYSHLGVVYINLAYAEKSTISVFDLSGRKVKTHKASAQANQISDLQKGTYIVRVNTEKGTKVEKVFLR